MAPKKSAQKEWRTWREDALDWFHSEASHPGSFHWVCEVLEMGVEDLRDWLETYLASDEADQKEMARKLVRFQIRH